MKTDVKAGDHLSIGDSDYMVEEVGEVANTNLSNLGHVSLVFGREDYKLLPGAIRISSETMPHITEGTHLVFYRWISQSSSS